MLLGCAPVAPTRPPQLQAPWISLHGVKDRVCSIGEARSFIAQTKDAKLIELPNVGHSYLGTDAVDWLPQFKAAFESIVAQESDKRRLLEQAREFGFAKKDRARAVEFGKRAAARVARAKG